MLGRAIGLFLSGAIGMSGFAAAQTFGESRLINLPTQYPVGYGTLELWFTHRFTQTVSQAGGYDLGGLDSAADVGIGLALGITRDLDVEVYRSSFFKQLEAAAKVTLARQDGAFPVGLAVRFGADYRGASGVSDRWSGFVQLVAGRSVGAKLDLFAVPMFASDTPTLRRAVNLGLGAAIHLPRRWDVALEVIPRNRDAAGGEAAWAVGLVKRVTGHEFLIYAGNSRATTADLLAGSDLPGGFARGDVRLGFNLVRRFPG